MSFEFALRMGVDINQAAAVQPILARAGGNDGGRLRYHGSGKSLEARHLRQVGWTSR